MHNGKGGLIKHAHIRYMLSDIYLVIVFELCYANLCTNHGN